MKNKKHIEKKIFLPFFILMITLVLSNCAGKPQSVEPPTSIDSTVVAVDSVASGEIYDTVAAIETTKHEHDTTAIKSEIKNILEQGEQGTIVYYCPSRMLENTCNNVSVTITKAVLSQAIKQLEKKISTSTGQPIELIQQDVTGSSINIATKMKVELIYSNKDFETFYKPEYVDQIFDGTNDMNWDWIIRPMKVGPTQLSIIISAYDKKNGRWIAVQTPPKIFNIKVQVDPRNYFSKLWGFLETNPEWLFLQIAFPLIAFFFGKKQRKKS